MIIHTRARICDNFLFLLRGTDFRSISLRMFSVYCDFGKNASFYVENDRVFAFALEVSIELRLSARNLVYNFGFTPFIGSMLMIHWESSVLLSKKG